MSFEIIPVDETPKRSYKKNSIYDPILTKFVERKIKSAKITMTSKKGVELSGEYLTRQLKLRIDALELKNVRSRMINGLCYLEMVTESS